MIKKCPTCKEAKQLISEFWRKNASRNDGYDWQCKLCAAKKESKVARARRDKRRYEKDKIKCKAREHARATFDTKTFKCGVILCRETAKHLHHVDHSDSLAVVPLCLKHHKGIHE